MNQQENNAMSEDRIMILLCHIAPVFGLVIILPLVIYLVKKEKSKEIAEHAREALNFQITYSLYALLSLPFFVVFLMGFFTFLAAACAMVILAIIATIKAADGILYDYPFTFRLIK